MTTRNVTAREDAALRQAVKAGSKLIDKGRLLPPPPSEHQAEPTLSADARDAARYRFIRSYMGRQEEWHEMDTACPESPEELDSIVDAAMAQARADNKEKTE